jgi:hypothetical protein
MTPEDFDHFFEDGDQSQDAAQSPLRAYFPVAVIELLRVSPLPPSRLFGAEMKRLETDSEAEASFTLDLFRLLGNEERSLTGRLKTSDVALRWRYSVSTRNSDQAAKILIQKRSTINRRGF